MKATIVGGAGFLGVLLARRLLGGESVAVGGEAAGPIDQLCIFDRSPAPEDVRADPRVHSIVGDVTAIPASIADVDVVFHLAGVVSAAAEADFDLGMSVNVDGSRAVLEACRAQPEPPVLVFASSLAALGADPALGPLGVVDDDTTPRPQSSYGAQKYITELLVAEYTRKGYLRGRAVRLMTVTVRPGAPNAAASGFLSGIIREPLAGQTARCPVAPDAEFAVSSPSRTIDGLVAAAAVGDADWGSRTAMNLPALTTTPAQMVEALGRVGGSDATRHVVWEADPRIASIVQTWPARFRTPRADRMGLRAPTSFDEIIREYVESLDGGNSLATDGRTSEKVTD